VITIYCIELSFGRAQLITGWTSGTGRLVPGYAV